jgi:hypothetical protein
MSVLWKIEINSGARASLVSNGLRKQIWRPMNMSRDTFFFLLPEGKLIDEDALNAMFDMWK